MGSKEAAIAQSSTLDRMGALAKWVAAKAEEMQQLDRRIERRIEHLQRSEETLRALFEAIREQVGAANAVSEELQKRTLAADRDEQLVDETLVSALEKASTLVVAVESKTAELQQAADQIVQTTADRLSELAEQTRIQQQQSAPVVQQWQAEADVDVIRSEFDRRSVEVVESIRRSAVEQIERLASQAAVAVEPVLCRIEDQRQKVESQLRAAVESAEDSLRRRAEDLCRTGDTVVDTLEQRLARRMENVRPRTNQAIDTVERAMNLRVNAMVDGAKLTVTAVESELADRVTQLRPRLNQTLQSVQDDLVEQLARLEEHAFAMTGWLEQRMTERVETLIARTRESLSQSTASAPEHVSTQATSLVCHSDEYPLAVPPNSVDVQIFVDRRNSRTAGPAIFQ